MKIFFNEDDLVIDDIPDDIMQAIERRAATNGRSAEDEVYSILFGPAISAET